MKKRKGMKEHHGFCCKMWLMKLSLVSFVFFVLNIWPGLMNWVANTHWAWFLGVAVLFGLFGMKHMWMHGMKKRKGRR